MKTILCATLLSTLTLTAFANQHSPYMGQDTREIKALSKSEIEGYLNGKGMGFAKAAELNHYPGPRHVLDLSKQLVLTREQKIKTQDLFNSMEQKAISLGRKLVEREKALDMLFAIGTIDSKKLKAILTEIGLLQARLRHVHLSAHLKQKDLLSPHQVMLYDQLRGYGSGHVNHGKHGHSH
jgi:Spy/CpxP family protein refolding chaperone